MLNLRFISILSFLIVLTSCGSNISVETFGDAKKNTPFTLKAANVLEQSVLENIGSCNFTSQNDPAYQEPLEFRIKFSDEINIATFSAANINNIGTGAATSLSWNIVNCGDKKNFLLQATGIVGDGSIIPLIDIAGIKYVDGDDSKEFGSSDNSVIYTKPGPFTWMGYADNNWSNNANWYGGVKPGVSDIAVFNNACNPHSCTVNVDENVGIAGIEMKLDFAGSITQAVSQSVVLGASGFTQEGGFYLVGANTFSVAGNLNISSGTFNSAGSLVRFAGTSTGFIYNIEAPTTNFNNVEFTFGTTNTTVKTVNVVGSLKVLGNLVMNTSANTGGDRLDGGEIVVEGDITIANWDSHKSTINMKVSGTNNQTITGATGESFASISVDKSGGTATFTGSAIEIKRNFTHLAGAVDFGTTKTIFNHDIPSTISAGTVNFYDVEFTFGSPIVVIAKTIVGTLNVSNDLTLNTHVGLQSDHLVGGIIDVKGNITLTHSDIGNSSTNIILSGTTDQTINQTDGDLPGNITINKASGKVILGANYISAKTGQDLHLVSGELDMAGFNLTVNNNLTLESLPSQTYLYTSCGTLTVMGATADLGTGITTSGNNPNITIADASNTEGANLDFIVTLSEPVCSGAFTVNYATSDGSATLADLDYTNTFGTLNIPVGNISGTISVPSIADVNIEVDETLNLTLSVNSHGSITDGVGVGSITNDDFGGFLWTGLGADDNWSTIGNWSGGVPAGASDIAFFNGSCTNCNANIDSSISIKGIILQSNYIGSITQETGNTLTVGNSHWLQEGGNFVGGNSAININGNFKQTGGSFTSTSATLGLGYNYPGSNPDGLRITGGTFLHNNGTMDWRWGHSNGSWNVTSGYININSTLNLNNLIISGSGHADKRGTIAISSADTIIVEGNLTLNASGAAIASGTIEVKGNISGRVDDGTSRIKLTGSGNQSIANNTRIPGNLEFASTGGTVSLNGTVYLSKGIKYTSGVVDTTGTHIIVDQNWRSNGGGCGGWCAEFDTNGMTFNNVTIILGTTSDASKINVLSDFNIDGNLTYSNSPGGYQRMNGGNINLKGDLLMTTQRTTGGSTTINLIGSSNQSVTSSTAYSYSTVSDSYFPSINIASTGGVVTFNGTIPISSNFTYTSGAVDLSGAHFIFGEAQSGETYSTTINAPALTFNNVTFRKRTSNLTIVSGLNVDGDLVYRHSTSNSTQVDGAAISLAGNLTYTQSSLGGNAPINFDGTINQTVSYSSGTMPSGSFTVNKTSAKIQQLSNLALPGGSQDLILTDGDWDMAGYDLTVNNDLTVANLPSQSYLYKNCGTLTVSGTTTDPGPGIIGTSSNPNITISDASIVEGGNLDFTVTLSESVCGGNFTMNYTSDDGIATTANLDYTDNDNVLTITPGNVTGIISVVTTTDATLEADEFLNINLNTASHGTITDASADGIILNDDTGPFLWTGLGADDNWSTVGNWQGGVTPGSGDLAVFDGSCTNCNSSIDTNIDVNGMAMNTGYLGAITMGAGNSATIGTEGYTQIDGTIDLADGTITWEGDAYIIGGTVIPGTSTLEIGGVAEINSIINTGASVFNNVSILFGGSGTKIKNIVDTLYATGNLLINTDAAGSADRIDSGIFDIQGDVTLSHWTDGSTKSLIKLTGSGNQNLIGTAGHGFNNIEIDKSGGTLTIPDGIIDFGADFTHTSGTVVFGTNNISRFRGENSTIDAPGLTFNNVSFVHGGAGTKTKTITGVLKVSKELLIDTDPGASSDRVDGIIEAYGNITVNNWEPSGSGLIKVLGIGNQLLTSNTTDQIINFEIDKPSGTLTFADGTMNFFQDFTHTNGSVVIGTNNLVTFSGISASITPGNIDFNDVSFIFGSGGGSATKTIVGNLKVKRDLELNTDTGLGTDRLQGGTIEVGGDLTLTHIDTSGSNTNITLNGTADQHISQILGDFPGVMTVNKVTGKVLQSSNINLNTVGQDLTFTGGDWDMGGFDLNVADTFTLDTGTTLYTNCGTHTEGTLINNGTIINSTSNPNITISDEAEIEGTNQIFTVSLSEAVCAAPFTVDYATADDLASLADSDYTNTNGTLNILAKSLSGTITVPTITDATLEPDEMFEINLSTASHGTITDATGVGIIRNDDAGAFMWTGLGGDDNWTTVGNWQGGAAPGIGDIAYFDGLCTNCNANVDTSIDIAGIVMNNTYTGIISQGLGNSINLRGIGWVQNGGTFIGSNSDITASANLNYFHIRGGSFTAPSTSVNMRAYDILIKDSATFVHNSAEVKVDGSINNISIDTGVAKFNNFNLVATASVGTTTLTNTVFIDGNLTLTAGRPMVGTFDVKGDLNIGASSFKGSGTIKLSGSTNQLVTAGAGLISKFEIASTGGTISFSGTPNFSENFTYTSGTVDTTGATLNFLEAATISSGAMRFNDVFFDNAGGGSYSIVGTMFVDGDFTYDTTGSVVLQDGIIEIKGNYNVAGAANAGNGLVKINGSTSQVIDGTGGRTPKMEIASTGGTVTIQNTPTITYGFTYLSGTVVTTGSTVRFQGNGSVDSGTMRFNNVEWAQGGGGSVTIVNTMYIDGNMNFPTAGNNWLATGTIELMGNYTTALGNAGGGSALVKLTGNTNQLVTGLGEYPPLEVASSGGTVTFTGDIRAEGSTFKYTSGTVDATNSKFNFVNSTTIDSGTMRFGDVSFDMGNGVSTLVGTTYIDGNLEMLSGAVNKLNGGTVELQGNYILTSTDGGTSAVTFTGTNDQTIIDAGVTAALFGTVTVNKASGKVTQLSNVLFNNAGQDLHFISGDWDMAGFDLNIADTFTLDAGTTLYTNCGTKTEGTLVNNGTIVGSTSNPNITISDASIIEGGNLDFLVTLSEGVCGGNFTANFTTDDIKATTANSDYTDNDNILTITPGNLTGTITVVTTADATLEIDETLKVVLNTPSHGALTDDTGIGTILNDDDNDYLWDGGGADDNWSTALNWTGDVAPLADGSTIVAFSDDCTNCNVIVDANVDVAGFVMFSDYTGTITLQAGNTFITGTEGFILDSGTLIASDQDLDVKQMAMNGATLTLASADLRIDNEFEYLSGIVNWSGQAFITDSVANQSIKPGTLAFNNVELRNSNSNDIDLNGQTWTITGDLTLDEVVGDTDIGNGFIELSGDIFAIDHQGYQAFNTAVIRMVSGGSQTINGTLGGALPSIDIQNGTTVNLVGDVIITGDLIVSSGTISPGTSTVHFLYANSASIDIGVNSLNNMHVSKDACCASNDISIVGNLDINGNLNIDSSHNNHDLLNGTITLAGDLTPINTGAGGSTVITLDGTGTQSITGVAGAVLPNIIINSTGTVNLVGDIEIEGDFTYTAGTVVAGTSKVSFIGNLASNISSGTMTFNDVTIFKHFSSSSYDIIITGNMDVNGDLSIELFTNQTIDGGTISLAGDLTAVNGTGGSATITLDGAGTQTISGILTASLPNVTINSTGTVNLVGNIEIEGDLTYTAGTVVAGSSNVLFVGNIASNINSGAMFFNDVTFKKDSGNASFNIILTGNMDINGDLTVDMSTNQSIDTGTISLAGDFIGTNVQDGSASLTFDGILDQNISLAVGDMIDGLITVNKLGGKVIQTTNLLLNDGAQNLHLVAGSWDMAGFDLTIANDLTLETAPAQTYLYTNCGTLSVSGTTFDVGSGIISSASNPNITIADVSVSEGGNLDFTVTLSEAVCASAFTVNYASKESSATTANSDFTNTSGTLNIPAKSLTGQISVATTADANYEFDEIILMNLSSNSHGTLADSQAIGTILNDDAGGIIWSGLAFADDTWTNGLNWVGGSAPSATEVAVFDGTCTNCNSDVDANIDIDGILIDAAYTGTVTQLSGNTITLDTNGFSMAGGTFAGGDASITIPYPATTSITGGSFTSTSGDFDIAHNFIISDGVFNHNSGALNLVAAFNSSNSMTFHSGTNQLNDVEIKRAWSENIYISNDIYIDGDYSQNCIHSASNTFYGDYKVYIKGDFVSGRFNNGTLDFITTFVLDGTTDQTVSQTHVDGFISNLHINKASGTTFLVGDIIIQHEFIVTSGVVDVGTSNMEWGTSTSAATDEFYSGVTYNNFTMRRGWITNNSFSDGVLEVSGDFIMSNHTEVGTIVGTVEIEGDVFITDDGSSAPTRNNLKMILKGTGDQNLGTSHAAGYSDMITIDKPSGSVNITSNFLTTGTGSHFYIKQGSVNMAGYDLSISDTLTLDPGTFLYKNCGTLVQGTLANSGTIVTSTSNPNITISDESELEGTNQIFTVSLSEAVCASATTIDYLTTTGSAIEGTDFTDTNGTLNVPAKSITGIITVPTTVDADYEPSETFTVNISNTSFGVITDNSGLGSILNDDLSNFTWTGINGDSKWSTVGNWSGGIVPGASDIAVFDSTCTNCNSNIDVPASAKAIILDTGYTGTLTQEAGQTITIGTGGLTQAAGTFVGGDSLIDINKGNFKLSAGSFTSTSGIFDVENPDTGNRTAINISAAASFIHNNGHVKASGNYGGANADAHINLGKNIDFYDFDISGNYGAYSESRLYRWHIQGGFNAIALNNFGMLGTNNANGFLTLSSGIIEVRGDLYYDQGAHGTGSDTDQGYDGLIILNGTGNQEFFEVTSNGRLPNLVIDKTAGTVDAGSGTTNFRSQTFSLLDGTFNAPVTMEILNKQGNIGNDTLFKTTAGSVFNGVNTSLRFDMKDNASPGNGDIDLDAPVTLDNLYFSTLYNSTMRSSIYTFLNTNGFIVNNDLTIKSDIGTLGRVIVSGANIDVKGNVLFGQGANAGTAGITFSGTENQTLDATNMVASVTGNYTVNKASGKVVQLSDLTLTGGSQDLILTAGDWDQAGNNLTITNDLTVANLPTQSYLYKNCGVLTVSGTTTDVGSGITTTAQNPNITIADPSSNEGTNLDYIVTLTEAVCGSAVTVDYNSSNGTAIIADSDYTAASGTLNIPIGSTTGTISLTTTSDSYPEENETVNMTLSTNSHGTITDSLGVGTILNDDGAMPVDIYRSTGFGNTTALSEGTDNAGTDLTISGSIATFEYAQPDNMGVGDAIQYDSTGDSSVDSIIFISGRVSSTQYNVQTVTGAVVSDLGSADTDWAIFRAYISLSNAENGVENTGIDAGLRNFDTWSGGKDLISSSEVWNIAAYADAVDTTVVIINGWNTGKTSFINIYTPSKTSEVGKSQRHLGIWSVGGYILDPGASVVSTITITEDFVNITGLQVKCNDTVGTSGALVLGAAIGELLNISNNIFRGPEQASGITLGVVLDSNSPTDEFRFFNNIIYGFDGSTTGNGLMVNGATPGMVYNNSFDNNTNAINVQTASTEVSFKNNLVQNSITSSFAGSAGFHASSDYNISADGNMPGTNSITSSAVVFRADISDELRLDPSDTIAKNAGLDISGESILFNDFMEHPRGTDGSWDIGAHEAATKVYRSIASGTTTSLEVGTGNNMGISSGVVTFTTPVANNIGIGDAIQYDRSGDSSVDSLMFIYARTSSTVFSVRDKDGAIPADLGADDNWDIFRAYSSISNADNLLENTGLDISIRNFTDNVDLLNNNLEMVYPLYADAAFGSIGTFFGSNWIKSPTTSVQFYVPYASTEVGTTQRHIGQWSTSYVHFTAATTLFRPPSFSVIDGAQFFVDNDTTTGYTYGLRSSESFTLKNSIVRGPDTNTSTNTIAGVYNGDDNSIGVTQTLINNIFYNWSNSASTSSGVNAFSSNIDIIAYNNTFVDNERPINSAHAGVLLINNISQDLVLGFSGTYHTDSSNNLSFDINSPGAGSVNSSTLTFVNKGADDFDLAVGDTDAQSSGADLSNDAYFSFDKDIQGNSRPSADWDMGAFQY